MLEVVSVTGVTSIDGGLTPRDSAIRIRPKLYVGIGLWKCKFVKIPRSSKLEGPAIQK